MSRFIVDAYAIYFPNIYGELMDTLCLIRHNDLELLHSK